MSNILLMLAKKTDIDQLAAVLGHEKHAVIPVESGVPLRNYSQENPDIIIVDAVYGAARMEELRKTFPMKPILCHLPQLDAKLAVEMMRAGAFECFADVMDKQDVLNVLNHTIRAYYGGFRRGEAQAKQDKGGILKGMSRKWTIAGAAAAGFLLLLTAGFLFFRVPQPVRIDLTYENPTSVVGSESDLWIGDWVTQSVYRYENRRGSLRLQRTNNFLNYGPVALAKENNYLWTLGNDLVLRQHVINTRLDVLKSYRLAEHAPSGMAFVGEELWICDSTTRQLYRYALDRGVLAGTCDTGLMAPVGPAWDGKNLWLADAKTGRILLYKQNAGIIEEQKAYRLPDEEPGTLTGISLAGKNLCLLYSGTPSYLKVYPVGRLRQEK